MDLSRRRMLASLLLAGPSVLAGAEAVAAGAPPRGPADLAVIGGADLKAATRAAVAALGGMRRFVAKGSVVFVKPNIGWARAPAQGANTHPDVVASVVEQCYEAGARVVTVADHTLDDPERCYRRSGIQAAAEAAGARVVQVDPARFRRMNLKGRAVHEREVYLDAVEADVLVNVPVVKHHSLCRASLGMKNWLGLLGGRRADLHERIDEVVVDAAAFFRAHLTIVDASRVMLRNGPQGGSLTDVRQADTVAATVDPVAADAFAAGLLGLRPGDLPSLRDARERGLGTDDLSALHVVRRRV